MERARPSPSTHYGFCPAPTLPINNTSSTRSDHHLGYRSHLSPKDLAPSGSGTKSIPDPPSKFNEKKRGSDQTDQLHIDQQPLKKPRTTPDSSPVKLKIMKILPPLWEIGKCLFPLLKHQINYLIEFQEFENLKEEAQYLYATRADIEREIENERGLKIPTNECEVWLEKVNEAKIKVNGIEVEFNENKKFLCKLCPNIGWRMNLGKRIMTMRNEIAKLMEKSKLDGGVLAVAPPRTVERIPASTKIKVGTSSYHTLQKILGCLRDEKCQKIGVWGMGGVGKTTILQELNNLPEIIPMFQKIIWITVSKDWSVKNVQKHITERLSLKLGNDESEDGVKRKISRRLETMKYLLLLDDVWETVDLKAIGVPHPTRENGCKIVLTSRLRNVCGLMGIHNDIIKVEVLSNEEASDLFRSIVGDVVDSSIIEEVAREVVEECSNLPLALVVIGRSLRTTNDVHVWRNARTELGEATFQIGDEMEDLVFRELKFSFDRLKDDNVKNCFLYCALYPEDFEIPVPELIEHWWVEGFIDGKRNFGEAYDKGHVILNELANASLLEKIEDYRLRLVRVKMHDMIRDVALRITSSEGEGFCRCVVKAGDGITAQPNDEEWKQAERMSLMMRSHSTFLPERPNCTLLKTLLLEENFWLKEIPDSFFDDMHRLRVLNLSGTPTKELPSSLLNLTSLQGLFLGSSKNLDKVIAGVGHITRLEVLHVVEGWIKYLPVEVRELTHLRSLRLRFKNEGSENSPTDIIPEGLLSRLTQLEDLRILMDDETLKLWFPAFETKGVVEELVKLKQLTSLHFHFPKVEYLEHFLQKKLSLEGRKLQVFQISCASSMC